MSFQAKLSEKCKQEIFLFASDISNEGNSGTSGKDSSDSSLNVGEILAAMMTNSSQFAHFAFCHMLVRALSSVTL